MVTDARDRILVVVPCLNEAAHLPGLLAQLRDDRSAGTIVIADGGSSDGSQEIVRAAARLDSRVKLMDNPRKRQAIGINLAVARFGGGHDWLVRIDAHCIYPSSYVQGLLQTAQRMEAGSVVVPMRTQASAKACFQQGVAAAQNSLLGTGGSAHRRPGKGQWVEHGHHALMRLADFSQAGGYCETFRANEDAELDVRLGANGTRIWLEPSLAIDYFPRRSALALWRQYYHYGRGRAMTVRRHCLRMRMRQMAPLAVAPAALAALAAPAFPPAALPALIWIAASLLYGTVLALRQRSGCVLWSGVAAIIMHAAWSTGFWSERIAGRSTPAPPAPLALVAPE